jgi:dienelactone hydrolase
VIERAVNIGGQPSLVAIVSEPADKTTVTRPAFIMLNAGLIHRVGPNRLHVRLGRALAAAGFVAMRIDLSGRGDSEPRRDDLSFRASGVIETQAAMRYLETSRGVSRFVLFGICSGAATTGDVAYLDPRVAGAVIVEGPSFATSRFYVRYYANRLRRFETWQNTLQGTNAIGRRMWRLLGVKTAAPAVESMVEVGAAPAPKPPALAAALQEMADRGVEQLAIYSGSTKEYNYEGQLREAFPSVDFRQRLEEAYFPEADHTFTRLVHQQQLIHRVLTWMERFADDGGVQTAELDADLEQVVF